MGQAVTPAAAAAATKDLNRHQLSFYMLLLQTCAAVVRPLAELV